MIGKTLAHYEITGLLGKGGMGEVYRARDTKLGRDVALKILPEELARDAERRARFEREARTLASIQHANIASIHDFDQAEGYRFLVMELAEGQDLAESLQRGPIPLDEALNIARQVALGLQAAHDVGIVHRDLKPANVMLATNGDVKILDFGLARAFAAGDEEQDLKQSPTITAHMTHAGVILGTAAYMSPEQARGKRIDRRTDIWAFGCVLFEMLSGQQAFPGETVSDVIAKIIQGEPRWQALPDNTRPSVHKLLRRCLRKDPNTRIHDIADARVEIDDILSQTDEPPDEVAGRRTPPRRVLTLLPWIAAVTLAAVVAGLASRPTPEHPIVQFDIFAPPQNSMREFSLSPDGRALTIVAVDREGTRRLWMRQLDTTEMRALSGTEDASFPFWSPNAQSIGFFASGKLKRIDVASETIQTLADAPNGRGGAWSSDDVILFTPEGRDGLYRISASGGDAAMVTRLADNEESHRMPHFLPDGRRFVYVAQAASLGQGARVLGSLDSDESTELFDGVSEVYAPPGYLLYVRELTLMAQRFDADALALQGQPVPLAKRISGAVPVWARANFAVSNNGVLAYSETRLRDSELVWFDRNGLRLEVVSPPGVYELDAAALSPDGSHVWFMRNDPSAPENAAIWMLDLERGTATRVTPFSRDIVSAAWSHDGESVFFSTGWSILQQRLVGAADPDTIWSAAAPGVGDTALPSWVDNFEVARDGSFITFAGWNSRTDQDVWRMQLDGQRQVQPLAVGPHSQDLAHISLNGRWIAYSSDESGRAEVYVRSASPGSRDKTLVSTAGGSDARWSRDGSVLYYVAPDRQLMAVQARFVPTFQAGLPVALFEAPEGTSDAFTPEFVAVDAERFLFNVPVAGAKPSSITVMLNWDQAFPQ